MRVLIPYHKSRQDHARLASIRDTTFTAALAANLAICVALLVLSVVSGASVQTRVGLAVVAVLILLNFFVEFQVAWARGDERFSLISSANYLQTSLALVLTFPLLYFLRLYGLYLTVIAATVAYMIFVHARFPIRARLRFSKATYRELLGKGAPIMVADFLIALIVTSDRLIVSAMLGQKQLGYYGVALMGFLLLTQLPGTANEVLEPRVMKRMDSSDSGVFVSKCLLQPLLHTAYLVPYVIGPALFAVPVAIPLLLPRYLPGVVPLQVLCFGAYFLALAYVPRPTIVARGWQTRIAFLLPIPLAGNIALSVILVKAGYGLLGVAAGSSVSFIVLFLTLTLFLQRRLRASIPGWDRFFLAILAPFAVLCVSVFTLSRTIPRFVRSPLPAAVLSIFAFWCIMALTHALARRRYPLLAGVGLPHSGILAHLRRIAKRSLCAFCYRADDEVAVASLSQLSPAHVLPDHGLLCRPIVEEDRQQIQQALGRRRADRLARRLEESQGVLLIDDNEIAGYAWYTGKPRLAEGAFPFLYAIRPKDGMLYIFDVFVRPEYRGRGGATALLAHVLNEARRNGYDEVCLTCDARNPAMLRVISRLGFRIVGRLRYRHFLWRTSSNTAALRHICSEAGGKVGGAGNSGRP